MGLEDGRLYLAEYRLHRVTDSDLALLQTALSDACARLSARGEPVAYVGSTFLPASGRLLSLFRAEDADVVRRASVSSQAPLGNLEAAVELEWPPTVVSSGFSE